MGMPSVNVSFTEQAIQSIKVGSKGVVGLILKATTVPTANPKAISDVTDIPTSYTAFNKSMISNALLGYVDTPKKVICYFVADGDTVD